MLRKQLRFLHRESNPAELILIYIEQKYIFICIKLLGSWDQTVHFLGIAEIPSNSNLLREHLIYITIVKTMWEK